MWRPARPRGGGSTGTWRFPRRALQAARGVGTGLPFRLPGPVSRRQSPPPSFGRRCRESSTACQRRNFWRPLRLLTNLWTVCASEAGGLPRPCSWSVGSADLHQRLVNPAIGAVTTGGQPAVLRRRPHSEGPANPAPAQVRMSRPRSAANVRRSTDHDGLLPAGGQGGVANRNGRRGGLGRCIELHQGRVNPAVGAIATGGQPIVQGGREDRQRRANRAPGQEGVLLPGAAADAGGAADHCRLLSAGGQGGVANRN